MSNLNYNDRVMTIDTIQESAHHKRSSYSCSEHKLTSSRPKSLSLEIQPSQFKTTNTA